MRYLFYILMGVLLLPVGIYIYYFFGRLWKYFFPEGKKKVSVLASVAAALICVRISWPVYGLGAVVVLYFIVLCLILDVSYLLLGRRSEGKKRRIWNFLRCSGILPAAMILIFFSLGYANMQQVVKKEYKISSSKLPVGEELKIAAVTDLHLGTTMDVEELEEWCKEIAATKPDLLVLVGDIFDENTKREQMEEAAELFGRFPASLGVCYVLGNHDPNWYSDAPAYSLSELTGTLKKAGVHVLEDEIFSAGEFCTLIGRKDASVQGREEIRELTRQTDSGKLRILLDHQPGNLEENRDAGVDLQISGHTHGGQIWPTGQLAEIFGINEINYGYRKLGDFQVVVSSGMGGWGYPIRTGGRCEYVIIQIEGTREE